MKLIKVYGCSKTPTRKDLVRRAAVYFLSHLLPRKRNIEISIHVEPFMIDAENVYGECYHIQTNPSKFKIRLEKSLNDFDLISTLAHEFVHVRQFNNGELAFIRNTSRWKGVYYSDDDIIENEEPWEIEPRETETRLALDFFSL